jgi:hypothetical protein
MVTAEQYVYTAETVVRNHTPYLYGGVSLTEGCDCSGMFWGTNAALGIPNGPRTSEAMWAAWPKAPGPALGIAVFFRVPGDGGDPPQHMGLCISSTQMVEEPHTGAWGEIVNIPNNSTESIEGYCYVPGVTYGPTPPPAAKDIPMITSTPSGNGYWVAKSDGSVWSYGDAQYLGGLNPGAPLYPGGPGIPAGSLVPGDYVIGIAAHPQVLDGAQGYWLTTAEGRVYAFGTSDYFGAPA